MVNRIRVIANRDNPWGLVVDEHGDRIDGIRAADIAMHANGAPRVSLQVAVNEVDVEVDAAAVHWHGLDRVPVESLRAELARRENP